MNKYNRKSYHDYIKMQKTTFDGTNRTIKSRQNPNAQRNGNRQIVQIIGSSHHFLRRTSKLLETNFI